jgi:hypothetical protein
MPAAMLGNSKRYPESAYYAVLHIITSDDQTAGISADVHPSRWSPGCNLLFAKPSSWMRWAVTFPSLLELWNSIVAAVKICFLRRKKEVWRLLQMTGGQGAVLLCVQRNMNAFVPPPPLPKTMFRVHMGRWQAMKVQCKRQCCRGSNWLVCGSGLCVCMAVSVLCAQMSCICEHDGVRSVCVAELDLCACLS